MISFIIATAGKRSLEPTLNSIECWDGDEIIVIGNVPDKTEGHVRYVPSPAGHDWGSTERNVATPLARGTHLAHIDDDDTYLRGTRKLMAAAIRHAPEKLTIFRMGLPNGSVLWADPVIRVGNIGTPMMFMPNLPHKLGRWGEGQDCGDFHFLETMHWGPTEIVWSTDIIVQLGQPHV